MDIGVEYCPLLFLMSPRLDLLWQLVLKTFPPAEERSPPSAIKNGLENDPWVNITHSYTFTIHPAPVFRILAIRAAIMNPPPISKHPPANPCAP